MNSSIFRITFFKSTQDLNDDYERLSEHEKEKISNLDAESFFDYEEKECYICFLITTHLEIQKYIKILKDNLISHKLENLSTEILKSKFIVNNELKDKITNLNSIKYNFFEQDIENWILENLDIDTVLDRISEVGMDKLTDIEKAFLKDYH